MELTPSPGSHGLFSTSWKPAWAGSNAAQIISVSTKVTSEVHKRDAAGIARHDLGLAADEEDEQPHPSSGRNVDQGEQRQVASSAQPWTHKQIPADQRGDTEQHDEGVVIDVAGLEPDGAPAPAPA